MDGVLIRLNVISLTVFFIIVFLQITKCSGQELAIVPCFRVPYFIGGCQPLNISVWQRWDQEINKVFKSLPKNFVNSNMK